MEVAWGLIWSAMAFCVMFLTIKYYLPKLSIRLQTKEVETSETLQEESNDVFEEEEKEEEKNDAQDAQKNSYIIEKENSKEISEEKLAKKQEKKEIIPLTKGNYKFEIFNQPTFMILMLVMCAGFALLCGFTAAQHAITTLSLLKMTLAMAVFSCVFITDIELMIIPNMCSIILLVGRAITIIYEFIWVSDEAWVWLTNSIVALVVSLILLLVMAKVTNGGIGLGDVKLFTSFGFLCGIQALCFTLLAAFLLCSVASTALLLFKKKNLKDALPLGPFIWLGYGVTVLLSII